MISLITATLGRIEEFRILLESLRKQSYKDFELIVVDQNDHHILEEIVNAYGGIKIKYVRSNILGLSFNRNIGLKYAQGDIIGFPDDDCFYDDNLLMEVASAFEKDKNKIDLIAVSAKDVKTGQIFIKQEKSVLNRKQLFYNCISYNFFIRKMDNMCFDEKLGVGAEYGSGEETDFLWTYLSNNSVCKILNTSFVHHQNYAGDISSDRAFRYGLGFGAIMKKEIVLRRHYCMSLLYLNLIMRAIGGFLLTRHKRSYYNTFWGRVKGFVSYNC